MIVLLAFLLVAGAAPLHAQSLTTAEGALLVPSEQGGAAQTGESAQAGGQPAPSDSAGAPQASGSGSTQSGTPAAADLQPASNANAPSAQGQPATQPAADAATAQGGVASQAAAGAATGQGEPAGPDARNALASMAVQGLSRPYPGSQNLPDLLGMTIAQVFTEFGAPQEIFPIRGVHAWQDDVVFYYPDHSYLFWFRDRVWQARVDRRFASSMLGFRMGESKEEVMQAEGPPFHADASSYVYILPDRGFPVRARLFFENDRLIDLYVYRGDF